MINITSVIPVSVDLDNIDKIIEFRLKKYDKIYKKNVKYFFVLHGKTNKRIEEILNNHNVKYIYNRDTIFNHSKLRNIGLNNVNTKYVIFEDIDLIHEDNFYNNINNDISILDDGPFNFLSIPVAYLSKKLSNEILNSNYMIDYIKENVKYIINFEGCDNEDLQHYIHMSSLIVLKTNTAFFIGGFDESFDGWGGEDRDFIFRLLSVNTKIVLPNDFSYTSTESSYTQHKYVGWKALWAIHGDYMHDRGYLSFHLFHDKRNWRKSSSTELNINYAAEKARIIGSNYYKHITPIKKDGSYINYIYGRNPHILNLDIYNYLNGFEIIEEEWPLDYCNNFIADKEKVGVILFWNPYGTEKRLKFYNQLKDIGYHTIVAERGALPNSIIFDKSDLCVYSNSYKRYLWDKDITECEYEYTHIYINNLIEDDKTLEKNPARVPEKILHTKLNLNRYIKIILVCFQLDDDTVTNTNYEIKYKYFIEQMHLLAKNIPEGWLLLYKNHPLSNYSHNIENAKCVDSYHIHDLLRVSNHIVVYNSGVGLIAQAFKKHVFIFGPAFYADKYFNTQVRCYNDIIEHIKNRKIEIDIKNVIKFYSYLIHNLYSFCTLSEPILRKRKYSNPVYFKRISYYSINIYPHEKWVSKYNKIFDPKKSILFKRFYSFLEQKKINQNTQYNTSNKHTNHISNKYIIIRKIKKLIHSPYKFFSDSKTPLKYLKFLFKKC